jgi:hypothetical protein
MRDSDIRVSLRQHLGTNFGQDPATLIVDEFSLCCGRVRADIAVINGEMKGFEIKSDADSLRRLSTQLTFYGKVFDTATIVVGPRHIDKATELVPPWWGILLASEDSSPAIKLECIRAGGRNPQVDPEALAQLLWRDEVLAHLRLHNLHKGLLRKPRKFIWEQFVKSFTAAELQEIVRSKLKSRKNWPPVAARTRCGVRSRPPST